MDINEIARLAGVSRATVSRYLNNGYVSQAKRDLIAKVIEETGYVPSRQAQQLRTGKTGIVGVIIPKINSQSVSRMMAGINEVLTANNYQTLLACSNNDYQSEIEYLRVFSDRNQVEGIILIATVITKSHLKAFSDLNVPLVILGQQVEGSICVFHDDRSAVHDVTAVALKTGSRPAYIGVIEQDRAAGLNRRLGFLDACREAGITPEPKSYITSDFTMDSGYFCCEQLLEDAPDIDTIVCATDTIAFGVLACLREYGRRVPEDVQVTGIGDSDFSRAVSPSLTTAHLFYKTSGADSALLLVDSISKRDEAPRSRELKMGYEVYVRTSTR